MWQNAKKLIQRYDYFLVSTHCNPDADAISSSLALAALLRALGKKVVLVNDDAVPSWLMYLPGAKQFKQTKDLKRCKVNAVIVVDCGDLDRIGGVVKYLQPSWPILNIDHHVTNKGFGHVNVVDVKASSTAEMIDGLLKAFKQPINQQLAALLYAGIMTDTGSFRYENTSARTHAIVSQLMLHGINASSTYERLYPRIPNQDMRQFTQLLSQAELLLNNQVYCLKLNDKILASFSKDFDLKERLFAFLRMVAGIEVVMLVTALKGNEVRLNFRSQGQVDVAQLSARFGGGGHRKAAGATVKGKVNTVLKDVLTAIKSQL